MTDLITIAEAAADSLERTSCLPWASRLRVELAAHSNCIRTLIVELKEARERVKRLDEIETAWDVENGHGHV